MIVKLMRCSLIPPSPEAVFEQEEKASDATLALEDLMAAYEADYEAEERLTEEEKEYLKNFCDPSDRCPVRLISRLGYKTELMVVMR
jgi:hypothetical protein